MMQRLPTWDCPGLVSFTINLIIVLAASKVALFFAQKPAWVKLQKWFMASASAGLAIKMASTKTKIIANVNLGKYYL